MTYALLAASLFLGQTPSEPPPPSPPPLVQAPEATPQPMPPQPQPLGQPYEPQPYQRAAPPPAEPEVEPAPGTPTEWWKRALVEVGVGAGVGGGLGAVAGILTWQLLCGRGVCSGEDLFTIFMVGGLAATFTIPAGISIAGRALGGRAKYGYALLGTAVFAAAGLILSLVITGGSDLPIAAIPIFSTLMVLGGVGAFELVSFLRTPKVKAEPVLALTPGGGMVGLRGTF